MKILSQILLLFSIAAMFTSCNNSTSGLESITEPIAYTPDGKCTIDLLDAKTREQLDSLRVFCDTIFVHSVVNLYKDTVYDDTVNTGNEKYTTFIYLDRKTDKYDTLTKPMAEKKVTTGPCDSVPIYCTLDSSDVKKTFSCSQASICYSRMLLMRQAEIVKARLPDPVTITNKPLCSQPGYRCVIDSVYHTFHTTYRTKTRDTTFLNYGPTAWTDYIPAVNAPAFDTAAFRNALDTLDTQNEIFGMDTLLTGYSISVEGLPDWASNTSKCTTTEDSKRVCIYKEIELRPISMLSTYPTSYNKRPFYLWNNLEAPLEKDTLITWKLKYSYDEGNSFKNNTDSLTITTLFRGI